MNIFSKGLLRLARMIDKKSFNHPTIIPIGEYYSSGKDSDYIKDGFNKNVDVYSIVSYAARKFAQIPWYVYKVKKGKTKEFQEYMRISADNRNPNKAAEILSLRKKAIDESIVENELSELLLKPNRYQGQDTFLEMLYGYKLLTGEGNIFKNKGENQEGEIEELILIPKQFIDLRSDNSEWYGISGYRLQLGNVHMSIEKDDLLMWKFPNYVLDPINKTHHRGKAPLQSMLYDMIAGNENSKNKIKLNKNQGARGVLYDYTNNGVRSSGLTPDQQSALKRLIDGKINTNDVAGAVAVLQGQWGYHALGLDANQLRMIEQANLSTQKLCSGFAVPYEFFDPQTTFANKEQAAKLFLYNHIAPACASLRDELNRSLLLDFNLDKGQYVIEYDVSGLPEAMEDVANQVKTLGEAWWFTPNQKLEKMGEEKVEDPLMDKYYIPSSLKPMDDLSGVPLDRDEEVLRQNGII